MRETSIIDIISPIMVGPSSSHTAGAVRLGLLAKNIYHKTPTKVTFRLYNSYAKTGKGHGTDKGLLAGFLGLTVDDYRIKNIFNLDISKKFEYKFEYLEDFNRHPNAVDFIIEGDTNMTISGDSIGAGEVIINSIDNFSVRLDGKYNTLLLVYKDIPRMITKVTSLIPVNIASLNCDRAARGEDASMCIALDGTLYGDIIKSIKEIPNIYVIRYIEKLES